MATDAAGVGPATPLAERVRSVRSVRSRTTDRPAVSDRRNSLSAAELLTAAEEVVSVVRAASRRDRPMVAASLPLGTDAVVTLTAAILGDFSLCFLDPSAPERNAAVLDSLRPDVLVEDGAARSARATPAEREGPSGYVAMSSGSMGGGPKAVLSPWEDIDAFVPAGAEALELDETSVWGELSHPSYDMAMTNLLLASGTGCGIQVSAALGDRLRPLGFADRVEATHLRCAPRFIDLAAGERRRGGRHTLQVWGSGGDRLSAGGVRQVFALGVPAVVNTYGTSETIGFASAAHLRPADELPARQGTVTIGSGEVGPWQARLVDDQVDSMLAIESSHLPRGYLFGHAQGAFPRWEPPGRVLTGDVGARAGEHLFCLGRAGRRVKRSASFVDLDEVDSLLREAHGVVSFTAAVATGELVTLVETSADRIEQLRRALPSSLRPDTVPDTLVAIRQLPLLGNGKVDQGAATRLAAEAVRRTAPGGTAGRSASV